MGYELFGARSCPYTREMREWLEWKGYDYIEYDVEADRGARDRMIVISGGQRIVPLLAENDSAVQIGFRGCGCVVAR